MVPGSCRVPGPGPRVRSGPRSRSPGPVTIPAPSHRVMSGPWTRSTGWVPTAVPGPRVGSSPQPGSLGQVGPQPQVTGSCMVHGLGTRVVSPPRYRVSGSGRDPDPGSQGHVGSTVGIHRSDQDPGPMSHCHVQSSALVPGLSWRSHCCVPAPTRLCFSRKGFEAFPRARPFAKDRVKAVFRAL